MISVLVIAHAPLATALVNCTRHVFGELPKQFAALDVIPDEDPEAALEAARYLLARTNDGGGAVVFTDLYGATPARIATRLACLRQVAVISGVSLPMLVKALGRRRGADLPELVDLLIDAGRGAVIELGLEQYSQQGEDGSGRDDA
ncbi:MAG: PTS fructose transporter subunit IIA [Burkholderiaceae bacterium]|nr:PTS fructose transporter subunit IIA [Burkholderiaceae bacterium]